MTDRIAVDHEFVNEEGDIHTFLFEDRRIPQEATAAHVRFDDQVTKFRINVYPEDRKAIQDAGYTISRVAEQQEIIPIVLGEGRRIESIIGKDGQHIQPRRNRNQRNGTAPTAHSVPVPEPAPMQPVATPVHAAATPGLYAKMARVMGALKRVPKSGTNKFHGYSYATEADIADAVRIAMSEAGLALFSEILHVDKEGSTTRVQMRFTFACTDTGQMVDRLWWGEADDKQDKGISKAVTLAQKYFLKSTFIISTGDPADDPDSGVDAPEPTSGGSKRRNPAPASRQQTNGGSSSKKPAPKPAPEPDNSEDMPDDIFQQLMSNPSVQKASSAVPHRINAIKKLWTEGKLTADMDEADMVLLVVERLQNPAGGAK